MGTRQALKIAYLSGPVDAAIVYNAWRNDGQFSYFGTSYLSQYYSICSELGADGYVITTLPGSSTRQQVDRFLLENRPPPEGLKGVRYHLAVSMWCIRTVVRLIRYKPDILITTAMQNYWFFFAVLKFWNVTILPSIHCTLWQKFAPLPASWRLLLAFNRILFFRHVRAVMAVSNDIAEQVLRIARPGTEILIFNPTYRRSQFTNIPEPHELPLSPFCIFFAGRVEANKGVYDLIAIAQRLEEREPGRFRIHICGDGSQLDNLRQRVRSLRLEQLVILHGWCDPLKIKSILGACHCAIVPTTSVFEEGFNKVCAEAILAGRPLITSAVCPALSQVRDAAIEVPPDDTKAYCEAILRLYADRALYEEMHRACFSLQDQFYNECNSWGARLKYLLRKHFSHCTSK